VVQIYLENHLILKLPNKTPSSSSKTKTNNFFIRNKIE